MGVGGNFWDLLKPYGRNEGFDFLRNKRVAVDLSFWIVQHETAIKGFTRNPHIRLTFFRTINLFSKFGAYPVFILDGTPSPMKSQARIARFYKSSGVELSSLPEAEEGVSVERNRAFTKCVRECVELLELLGMPILKAKGEAEALCAELNSEGYVDACITADSDAFLYGAHCVIKRIQPNSKEPFECYYISDIEAGLALKRRHLIAVSLLVGNDYDLSGITGIGVETAVRFVKCFSDAEVLDKLHEIARQDLSEIQGTIDSVGKASSSPGKKSPKLKSSHCSHCGHPGNKKAHFTLSCECCNSTAGTSCFEKPVAFKCNCSSCDLYRKEKERKKNEAWHITVCRKIASEKNSVNDEIIQIYLKKHHGVDDDPCIGWATPRMEMLIDYLAYHQHWEPSYIRQRLLPMLSTLYLRNMASKPTKNLLHGQYEFHCVQRVKTRYGHQCYVVNWKKAGALSCGPVHIVEEADLHEDSVEVDFESLDEEPDIPSIHIGDDACFLSTDEDMELVRNAFPQEVAQFLKEKEMKSQKKKSKSGLVGASEGSKLSATRSTQLSIKEFYRASKASRPMKTEAADDSPSCSTGKRKESSTSLSKSARRKLLFG